jgi:hypothetical protein
MCREYHIPSSNGLFGTDKSTCFAKSLAFAFGSTKPDLAKRTAFSLVRFGIETNVFHPIDCRVARQQLGLDQSP